MNSNLSEALLAPFVLLLHIAAQLCLELLALVVQVLAWLSVPFTCIIHILGYYYEYRNKQRANREQH